MKYRGEHHRAENQAAGEAELQQAERRCDAASHQQRELERRVGDAEGARRQARRPRDAEGRQYRGHTDGEDHHPQRLHDGDAAHVAVLLLGGERHDL